MAFDVHATEEEDKLVLLSAVDRLGGSRKNSFCAFWLKTG